MNKSHAKAKLSDTRTSETPRNQASKRLELPVKWRKEAKQGRKSNDWIATESHDPLEYPFHHLKETITALELITKHQLDASQTLLWSGALWLTESTAIIHKLAEAVKKYFNCQQVISTRQTHTPGNISKLVRYCGESNQQAQAHDLSVTFKRAFTLPALHAWTLFAWTLGQARGGGGRPAKYFYHCYP